MVYDSVRQRIVLFSGLQQVQSSKVADTWEWDGVEWTQAADTGPDFRVDHAMAYDAIRERIVLFGGAGGTNPSGLLNDTWEYDGHAWTKQADTGPSRRTLTAIVFSGTRAVLFGGKVLANADGQSG
jgi:hypothetical protein